MAKKRIKAAAKKPAVKATLKLATPKLEKGEEYIGAIVGANGKGHHVILLAGDESGTWQQMMDSAKARGGDLPDRVEQALMFRDHKDKFQRDWYWSNAQHADFGDYAWYQYFGNGYQSSFHKGITCRARDVRRLPI
jgi:hypothetical protein